MCPNLSSELPNGEYIDLDKDEKYTSGETIHFRCDKETRVYPDDSLIRCSTVGWLSNATCAKGYKKLILVTVLRNGFVCFNNFRMQLCV